MRASHQLRPQEDHRQHLLHLLLDARIQAGRQGLVPFLIDMAVDEAVSAMSDEQFWSCMEQRFYSSRSPASRQTKLCKPVNLATAPVTERATDGLDTRSSMR